MHFGLGIPGLFDGGRGGRFMRDNCAVHVYSVPYYLFILTCSRGTAMPLLHIHSRLFLMESVVWRMIVGPKRSGCVGRQSNCIKCFPARTQVFAAHMTTKSIQSLLRCPTFCLQTPRPTRPLCLHLSSRPLWPSSLPLRLSARKPRLSLYHP